MIIEVFDLVLIKAIGNQPVLKHFEKIVFISPDRLGKTEYSD